MQSVICSLQYVVCSLRQNGFKVGVNLNLSENFGRFKVRLKGKKKGYETPPDVYLPIFNFKL